MLADLTNGTGPGTNPGRGAELCQANPGTYAIGLISWAVGTQLSPSSKNWYQRKLER